MSTAHVIWIYDNGIKSAVNSDAEWKHLVPEIGDAILQVCTGDVGAKRAIDKEIDFVYKGGSQLAKAMIEQLTAKRKSIQRIASVAIYNHGNCVNHCSEINANDSQLFLWSENCLQRLEDISAKDLQNVQKIISEEQE